MPRIIHRESPSGGMIVSRDVAGEVGPLCYRDHHSTFIPFEMPPNGSGKIVD
ncbi:MAG: hypothetical protein ACR2GI_07700 [Thermomicrobiales bacterium]